MSIQVVSILILLDSLLLFSKFLSLIDDFSMFQSLFYWILFFYMENPLVMTESVSVFQSLFYWILFFYFGVNNDLKLRINVFQSLFYWILFFYVLNREIIMEKYLGFNPYSTGFSSFIYSEWEQNALEPIVSILILLDSLLL